MDFSGNDCAMGFIWYFSFSWHWPSFRSNGRCKSCSLHETNRSRDWELDKKILLIHFAAFAASNVFSFHFFYVHYCDIVFTIGLNILRFLITIYWAQTCEFAYICITIIYWLIVLDDVELPGQIKLHRLKCMEAYWTNGKWK